MLIIYICSSSFWINLDRIVYISVRPDLGEASLVIRRAPKGQHKGTPASKGTQLKCLYANADNMGNKQEEIKTCACLHGCDLIGITKTWWDGSYDWSIGMEGCRLFRKDR